MWNSVHYSLTKIRLWDDSLSSLDIQLLDVPVNSTALLKIAALKKLAQYLQDELVHNVKKGKNFITELVWTLVFVFGKIFRSSRAIFERFLIVKCTSNDLQIKSRFATGRLLDKTKKPERDRCLTKFLVVFVWNFSKSKFDYQKVRTNRWAMCDWVKLNS